MIDSAYYGWGLPDIYQASLSILFCSVQWARDWPNNIFIFALHPTSIVAENKPPIEVAYFYIEACSSCQSNQQFIDDFETHLRSLYPQADVLVRRYNVFYEQSLYIYKSYIQAYGKEVIDLYQPDLPYSDGPLPKVTISGFKKDEVSWTSSDFRFTQKGDILYAFQMRWPENNRAVIKSLMPNEKVKSVRLLGAGEISFEQPFGTLVVNLPDNKPTEYVNCLAIELG